MTKLDISLVALLAFLGLISVGIMWVAVTVARLDDLIQDKKEDSDDESSTQP